MPYGEGPAVSAVIAPDIERTDEEDDVFFIGCESECALLAEASVGCGGRRRGEFTGGMVDSLLALTEVGAGWLDGGTLTRPV